MPMNTVSNPASTIAPVSDAIGALDRQGIELLLGTAATEGGAAIRHIADRKAIGKIVIEPHL